MDTHFALWLTGLTLASTAVGGVRLVTQSDNRTSELMLDATHIRIDSTMANGAKQLMIFDGTNRTLIVAKPDDKTYMVATPESMKATGEKLAAQLAQMKEQMRASMGKMSPEQRQQMEAQLAKMDSHLDAGTPEVKFVASGANNEIAGFKCKGYKEMSDGQVISEGCYIPWDAGTITPKDFAAFEAFGEFMIPIFSIGGGPAGAGMPAISKLLSRYPGFPADRKTKDPGMGSNERLVSMTRATIPPALFAPPAGYTKSDKDPFSR